MRESEREREGRRGKRSVCSVCLCVTRVRPGDSASHIARRESEKITVFFLRLGPTDKPKVKLELRKLALVADVAVAPAVALMQCPSSCRKTQERAEKG